MFKLVKSLTTDSKVHFPSCVSDKHLADRFLEYFYDKVEKITNIFFLRKFKKLKTLTLVVLLSVLGKKIFLKYQVGLIYHSYTDDTLIGCLFSLTDKVNQSES